MSRSACCLATAFLLTLVGIAGAEEKVPTGVYAVQRDSLDRKAVLPVKDGEALVVNHHRYVKKGDKEPPGYVIVRSAPDVHLDLLGPPKAIKDGVLLTLKPKAATALERLTRERLGRQVAIVIAGEVVTMHKVRQVIEGGQVKITSCSPGGAKYLIEQLQKNGR
jgi:hypothetical protein